MHVTPSEALRTPLLAAPGQARSHIRDISEAPRPRAYIVGAAGSGKTALLRQLRDLLGARGAVFHVLDERMDPASVPPSEVLIVDGLHLLDAARVEAVRLRAQDPEAALVVATRPWPRSSAGSAIARRLGADSPSIVLGPATRSEVVDLLKEQGRTLSSACIDAILALTGGLGWLVARAIDAHDSGPCTDPLRHADLWRSVEAHVSHRLDLLDDGRLAHFLELLALVRDGHAGPDGEDVSDLIAQGYAEGLLLRNGTMVPVVRSAIREALPPQRLADLGADAVDEIAAAVAAGDEPSRAWLLAAGDARLGASLAEHGDHLLQADPERAADLYDLASKYGFAGRDLNLHRAMAAWRVGDLDAAAGFVDASWPQADPAQRMALADVSAACWAARGMMSTGSDVYSLLTTTDGETSVKATIADVAAGSAERLADVRHSVSPDEAGSMSTLSIALRELESGLRASLDAAPSSSALTHLVRASELHTAARTSDPVPELPAVVAASVALGSGDLATARRVIDGAVAGSQGGQWAHRRLLLWQAWIAIQGERPTDARQALQRAETLPPPTSPRDELLRQSVLVSLARRYADMASLEAAWAEAMPGVRHVEVDLYTILPLSSLICAAARVGDATTLHPHFVSALDILGRLGEPPLWSAHLRWAGVQQGIVLNRPEMLKPHARALVAAAAHSTLASAMARAGGVWVAVLGGSVDPDAVETAGRSLAAAGLAWDGARLAAHGARRTDDRKVSSRLLSCARELHPQDVTPRPERVTPEPSGAPAAPHAAGVPLSEREVEVGRLVLEGRTYAEIGEVMFISPRTVEHHVAHIKRRLSVTSRSDLMAKLRVSVELATTTQTSSRRAIS
ncbi:LuxR C-terminal-related transcriptional regulator [Tessaracoccus sp. G1721]